MKKKIEIKKSIGQGFGKGTLYNILKELQEDIYSLLLVFDPEENGKKIIKLQIKNGKLDIKYEGGE